MTWKNHLSEIYKNTYDLEKQIRDVNHKIDKETFNQLETKILNSFIAMTSDVEKAFERFVKEYHGRMIKTLKDYRMNVFKTFH